MQRSVKRRPPSRQRAAAWALSGAVIGAAWSCGAPSGLEGLVVAPMVAAADAGADAGAKEAGAEAGVADGGAQRSAVDMASAARK